MSKLRLTFFIFGYTIFGDKMKTYKPKEQFVVADILFEMGMDYEVIEKVTGINSRELFLNRINMIDFKEKKVDNLNVKSKKSSKRR